VLVPDPKGGSAGRAVLLTTLPLLEALRLARVEHPTLRAAPSSGSVWRDCVARHGLAPALCDLSRAVPDLAPDDAAAEAVKRDLKEQEALAALKATSIHASVSYSVAGRRGPKPTAVYDMMRIPDPAAALTALLGAEVTVERGLWVSANGIVLPGEPSPFMAADLAELFSRLGNDNFVILIKEIGLSINELRKLGHVSRVLDWLAA
jgi:hypothetical protein